MEKPGCALLATVVVILLLASPLVLMNEIARKTQANQRAIAEAQAQVAAAARDRAYYDAVAQQARIEQLRAEGEREVLMASARATDNNTEIVYLLAEDYFATGGKRDEWRDVLPWAIVGVVVGIGVSGLDLGQAWRRRSRKRAMEKETRTRYETDRLPREEER
jgi:hypothetical protein